MPAPRRTVRVFVSSTFRDMQAERDHLVKVVFPELRERLDPYRVDLIDIDLRWGVTEDQAENGHVLAFCLEQIDESRPFFVGLLGHRYGWVPDNVPRQTLDEHPWLRQASEKSITEVEILYGALSSEVMRERSYFYFRAHEALETVSPEWRGEFEDRDSAQADKLRDLKRRIRRSGARVMDGYPARWEPARNELDAEPMGRFRELDVFGTRVVEDLWQGIRAELALPPKPAYESSGSWLEGEAHHHLRFIDARLQGHVVRSEVHESLMGYVSGSEERVLLLTGPPGSGKSSVLANLARQLRTGSQGSDPTLRVLPHFVGAADSGGFHGFARKVLAFLELEYEPQPDIGEITARLRLALSQVPEDQRLVIIVDAVDQALSEEAGEWRLDWIPSVLPGNVRVIVSSVNDLDQSAGRSMADRVRFREMEVGLLSDEERLAIATTVPAIAAKTLDDAQLKLLLENPATRNPLFLRVALEELRGFGSFERLTDRIRAFPEPGHGDEVIALFGQVLARIEEDFGSGLTRHVLGLLAVARRGLSESELRDLVQDMIGAEDLFPVLRQLRPYLMHRGSVLTFFHDALEKATRERYLAGEALQQKAHRRLATYFEHEADFIGAVASAERIPNERKVEELPHQLLAAGQGARLAALLEELSFVEAKVASGRTHELAGDYERAAEALGALHPKARNLSILSATLLKAIGFLERHPEAVFQVSWNNAWWYDAPATSDYYRVMPESEPAYVPPWSAEGPKLSSLMERWQEDHRARDSRPWLRTLFPPHDLYAPPHRVLRGRRPDRDRSSKMHTARWSPSGDHLAGIDEDAVLIWEMKGASDPIRLPSDGKRLLDFAWSANGRLASLYRDGSVHLWDPSTPLFPERLEAMPKDRRADPTVIEWSPIADVLAVGSEYGHVTVWSRLDEVVDAKHLAQEGHILTLAWHPSRRAIATGGTQGTVRVWELEGGQSHIDLLAENAARVTHVAWSPDGTMLAAACDDQTGDKFVYDRVIRVWTLSDPDHPVELRGHTGTLTHLSWDPGGGYLASVAEGQPYVSIWDSGSNWQEKRVNLGGRSWIRDFSWSSIDLRFAVSRSDVVEIWDLASRRRTHVLSGHGGPVLCVAWSPIESRVASGSSDGTVRVWDPREAGEPLMPLGHTSEIKHVAWAPEDNRFITMSEDGALWLWSPSMRRPPVEIRGRSEGLNLRNLVAAEWSPGGDRIAAVADPGTVEILTLDTEEAPTPLPGHSGAFMVSWSHSGAQVATASLDANTVRVWGTQGGAQLLAELEHDTAVDCVAWSPSDGQLATGCSDLVPRSSVRVWAFAEGPPKLVQTFQGGANHLAWSPTGALLAGACSDQVVRIWNPYETRDPLVLDTGGPVESVVWLVDGTEVATHSSDRCFRRWRLDSPNEPAARQCHGEGTRWSTSPASNFFSLWSLSGTAEVWKWGAEAPIWRENYGRPILACRWSPDGTRLAIYLAGAGWEVRHLEKIHQPLRDFASRGGVGFSRWSPDSEALGFLDETRKEVCIGFLSGHEVLRLRGHSGWIRHLEWSPDACHLASASVDGTIRVWDTRDGRQAALLESIDRLDVMRARDLCWLGPDRVAIGCRDEEVRIWDWETRDDAPVVKALSGHGRRLAWAERTRRLAGASVDGTVQVWGPSGGVNPSVLSGHEAAVNDVAWNPSGDRLATASDDGTLRIWDPEEAPVVLGGRGEGIGRVEWASDGGRIAAAHWNDTIRVWELSNQSELQRVERAEDTARLERIADGRTTLVWSRSATEIEIRETSGAALAWYPISGFGELHPSNVDGSTWATRIGRHAVALRLEQS